MVPLPPDAPHASTVTLVTPEGTVQLWSVPVAPAPLALKVTDTGSVAQMPDMHARPGEQALPQAPQWLALVERSVSQPSAAIPLQSP
ncbi:MAG: hypothetical protein U0324_06775 [Polyangiales bacterium]